MSEQTAENAAQRESERMLTESEVAAIQRRAEWAAGDFPNTSDWTISQRQVVEQTPLLCVSHESLRGQLAAAEAARAAVEAMIGEPCDCHGPGQPPLLQQLHAAEAARDAAQAELARTRQHFRTRHGIGCAFTAASVPFPEDMTDA